jgi:hypothetical protein
MGEKIDTCRILVGNPERKRLLGRLRKRRDVNVEMDLRQIVWGCVDWIDVAQDRDQWRALMNTVLKLRIP